MAAGAISSPGSHGFSTCKEACLHQDCGWNRLLVSSPCGICTKPIGWDTRFYDKRSDDAKRANDFTTGFVHADCAEDLAELQRSKGVTA